MNPFKLSCCVLALFVLRADAEIRIVETDDAVKILDGERALVTYWKTSPPLPDGVADTYRRSGYLHPITTPGGQHLTGDFSPRHLHQRGVFFAWTKTTANSRATDFWNLGKLSGRTRHVEVLSTESDETSATFRVRIAHEQLRTADDPIRILDEIQTVRVHPVDTGLQVDIDSRQTNVSGKPFTLHKYHYGGFAFRGDDAWDFDPKSHSEWLTAGGKGRLDGNLTRTEWVRFGGVLRGESCWLVVMSAPQNLRAPQAARLHPKEPYFCFTPASEEPFTWPAGETQRFCYCLLISAKKPTPDAIGATYERFTRDVADAK